MKIVQNLPRTKENSTSSFDMFGIPIFIIDDDEEYIKILGKKIKNYNYNFKLYTNKSNENVELKFITDVSKYDEAIIIADLNMGAKNRNGMNLLNYIMNKKDNVDKEYYCFILSGKISGNEDEFRKKHEPFNGKIYSKRASEGIEKLLLDLAYDLKEYKNYKTNSERSKWGDIISSIDEKLKFLSNNPNGDKGQIIHDNKLYSYSEMRNEISNENSKAGIDFIINYIHGIVKHKDLFMEKMFSDE